MSADSETHQTWSKFSFDVWAIIDRSNIERDAKLLWISLQQPLKQSTRPGYLERDGKPMEPGILAKILGKSEKKVRNWLADLELVGALKKDENGTLFEPFMAKHERERLKDRERKASGNSSGIPAESQRNAAGQREEPEPEPEPEKEPEKEVEEENAAATAAISGELSDEEWINEIKADPKYSGIDVDAVIRKCQQYCKANGKDFIRSRLIRWLEREEKPIQVATPEKPKKRKSEEPPPDQWKEVQQKIYPDSRVFDDFFELPPDIRQEIRDYVKENTPKSQMLNGAESQD
jgi:hypothetical protein